MSEKCIKIGCCVSFLAVEGLMLIVLTRLSYIKSLYDLDNNALIMYPAYHPYYCMVKCNVQDMQRVCRAGFRIPSLHSFIQATNTEVDKELLLNGLAVYSNLTNECQPLRDVSKAAKIQVHKVALVTLTNDNCSLCPLKNLTLSAQNAGYSVLIYFADGPICPPLTKDGLSEDTLLIPVLLIRDKDCVQIDFSKKRISKKIVHANEMNSILAKSDRTNVEIRPSPGQQFSTELSKMKSYLENLYYWFLVGPVITLEWLRRTKKFCWMSGGQQEDGGRVVGSGTTEIRNMEEAANSNEEPRLNSVTVETVENHHGTDDEGQPLFPPVSNAEYTRQTHRNARYLNFIVQICHIIAVGFCHMVLVIAALPVGISSGGLSFFRFDEDDIGATSSYFSNLFGKSNISFWFNEFFKNWSPLKILCFFLYSRFSCKATWTIQIHFSKLIRSDWFASNSYLLILGFVVPYCLKVESNVLYFATYNAVCTISNALFILILNKHKFVTRYVFYISVCMIFAYIESDVVAVFYFALSSQGSLNNLKFTALRTVAIVLTLAISFSSSMHIIRKLIKPEESLFEGLSEK